MKETKNGKILECNHCGNTTYMIVATSYLHDFPLYHWEEIEDHHEWIQSKEIALSKEYKLFLCPVCDEITLEVTETNYEERKIKKIVLYPFENTIINGVIPEQIHQAYISAQKVCKIDRNICLMALRRTLEMVCKDKGESIGNLYEMLTNLASKGALPPLLSEMAHILRDMGNSAAHGDAQEIPNELVCILMEFTRSILDYVYVLPNKIQEMQKSYVSSFNSKQVKK